MSEHHELPKGKKEKAGSKYTPIQDIRKDPVKWAKLNSIVEDSIALKTKAAQVKQELKESKAFAVEEINIDPKQFQFFLDAMYNNDLEERKDKLEKLDDVLDAVMGMLKYGGKTED